MNYVCPYCGEDRAEPFAHCGESSGHNVELDEEQYQRWLNDEAELDDLVYEVKK